MNPTPPTKPWTDHEATLAELKSLVQSFVSERKWEVFHTPKNLAASVAIEAAELLEHFQWLTPEESIALCEDPQQLGPIAEEICDVLAYLLSLSNALKIDLAPAFVAKMKKNAIKYPRVDEP